MYIVIQYKNSWRRLVSRFRRETVRIFAVDTLDNCKPVGVQRMRLNTVHEIKDRYQLCFAGDIPKDPKKAVDPGTIDKYNKRFDILRVASFQNMNAKTPES